ncbi:MAG: hypothetical protein KDD62_12360, partial [Bdellovibrionales bacterium]|nr:hypothetical protein [Bdellovibrionales bacterium]
MKRHGKTGSEFTHQKKVKRMALIRNLVYLVLFLLGVAAPLCLSLTTVPDHVLAEKNKKNNDKKGKKNQNQKPAQANKKQNKNNDRINGALRSPNGNNTSNRRGYVTYRSCPHSCSSNGLSKNVCRDWKEGSLCYIEDLTRPAGGPVNLGGPQVAVPQVPPPHYPEAADPNYGTIGEREACLQGGYRYQSDPFIDIHRVKRSGNIFGSKYRVYGSIEGVCLSEAGYFERGRKKNDFHV